MWGTLSGSTPSRVKVRPFWLALLLAPGMSADIVMFKLDGVGFAGALHDPVAALVFCTPANVNHSVINGKVVVRDGVLRTVDLPVVLEDLVVLVPRV